MPFFVVRRRGTFRLCGQATLDKGAGTFTLLVTEGMRALTLAAETELLGRVSSMLYHAYQNGEGELVVIYERDGETLRALTLE